MMRNGTLGRFDMALLLIVTVITLALVLFVRRRAGPTAREPRVSATLGIEPTEEMIERERVFLDDVMKRLESRIVASGVFRKEKIPALMALLRRGSVPFARINTGIAFQGDTYLTVPEKRLLGLNARMKYSHAFIAHCDSACLKTVEPKSMLECMYRDGHNREHRKWLLREFRVCDYITHVDILTIPDDACAQVKRLRKRHAIGEVPDLPLSHCDSECCGCTFLVVIPGSD